MKLSTRTQSVEAQSPAPEFRLHCPKCGSQLFLVSKHDPDPNKVKCFKCEHSFQVEQLRGISHALPAQEEERLGIGNKIDYNTKLKERLHHNRRVLRRIENGLRKLGRPPLSQAEQQRIMFYGEYWKMKPAKPPQLTPEEARKRMFMDD